MVALFKIDKARKCYSVSNVVNKQMHRQSMWNTHTMEYYSVVSKGLKDHKKT